MAISAAALEVRVGCEFRYESPERAPAIVLVRPAADADVIDEHWETRPSLTYHDDRDAYGNRRRRLVLPAGSSTIRYSARVRVPPDPAPADPHAPACAVEELPGETLLYTLPSRFCLSDAMAERAWELFGTTAPGWTRVQAICDWVHRHLRFAYGTSKPLTTASDVFEAGTGVCRDFAHLAITMCRALNIPARYAFGYLPDIGVPPPDAPMDFCAWFEAYLGDRWWTFDPRNNQRRIGAVPIARGRDAVDVPMVTTFGAATLAGMTVWADPLA